MKIIKTTLLCAIAAIALGFVGCTTGLTKYTSLTPVTPTAPTTQASTTQPATTQPTTQPATQPAAVVPIVITTPAAPSAPTPEQVAAGIGQFLWNNAGLVSTVLGLLGYTGVSNLVKDAAAGVQKIRGTPTLQGAAGAIAPVLTDVANIDPKAATALGKVGTVLTDVSQLPPTK